MHFLILGGTRFVGRAVVDAALAAGHSVTLFNRGQTAPGLYPSLETVIGDRTQDLSALAGRHFDAVVDCAGYDPAVVDLAVSALRDSADRYIFVSSVSVYADQSVPPIEGARLLDDDSYGGRKAAGERIVLSAFGPHALVARPGLIVGPYDPTERLPYWPRRLARGGVVLAPGAPDDPMQFVDVRDLAQFLVAPEPSGVFNLVGTPLPFGELLSVCRSVTGSTASLVWVSTPDLLAAGVEDMGVPLWIGDPTWKAANLVDGARARAAGFASRPVAETVADVLAWDVARGGPTEEPFSADAERQLLTSHGQ